ncbi:MAG: hypothetical protein QXL94_00785 [Candidatus Parvarchaeum sp.]
MYKSFLNGVSSMLSGGEFDEKEVYAMYGEPNVGKTSYLIGEAINLMSQGVRIIWVDTEGGFSGVWSKWSSIYLARFGNKIKLDDLFEYKRVLSVEDFAAYFGYKLDIMYDKNKVSVNLGGEIEKKDAENVYTKYGRYKGKVAVIVDSFSSPIRLQFSSNVQNFAGRSDAESAMVLSLMKFMEKVGAFVIITNHETKNPTDVYHPVGSMRGGATLKYYSKHIFYWQGMRRAALKNFRKVVAMRTPIAPEGELSAWVKIDGNGGYLDSNQGEIDEASK